MAKITSLDRYIIKVTERTNLLAEELKYNIAGKTFLADMTSELDGFVRGYIQTSDRGTEGPVTLRLIEDLVKV